MVQILNSRNRYGLPSKIIHWLTVSIVLIQYVYGISFVVFDETRMKFFDSFVESVGVLLVPLTLGRIVWILYAGKPELPDSVAEAQARIARVVQVCLYGMILFCAVTGFLVRDQNLFFYTFSMPKYIWAKNIDVLHTAHDIGVYVLMVFIALHVGAGLLHLILKDGVTDMMIR